MPPFAAALLAPHLARLKTYAALGAVAVILAAGAYVRGRIDGRQFEQAEAVAAAERTRKADEVARKAQEDENARELEAEAKRDASNDEIEARLLRRSADDDAPTLDGRFMRDLKQLR